MQYVAAEQGAQAGPSVSIVPVGPSDVVGQQPQQAEKAKPMPTGTVDTFFCYFKGFFKVPVSNSTAKKSYSTLVCVQIAAQKVKKFLYLYPKPWNLE